MICVTCFLSTSDSHVKTGAIVHPDVCVCQSLTIDVKVVLNNMLETREGNDNQMASLRLMEGQGASGIPCISDLAVPRVSHVIC